MAEKPIQIHAGMQVPQFAKEGHPSPYSQKDINVLAKLANAFANTKVVVGSAPDFKLSESNAIITVPTIASSGTNAPSFFPFKVYPTGETTTVDGVTFQGWNVRTGIVEVRPKFHQFLGLVNQPGWFGSWNQGNYSTPAIPDGCDLAAPDYSKMVTPSQFWLNPTPEILGGPNYGSYYAFYIRITPDTDNGSFYDGTISIVCHRFTNQTGSSIYDGFVFPSLAFADGNEYLPIAVVILTKETAAYDGFGVGTVSGDVWQHKRDHYTGRFPAGQNSLMGFCSIEDWIEPLPDPDVASPNRWFYPGDYLYYYTGTPGHALNGNYVWRGSPGTLGIGNNPASAGAFQQVAQFG
jgi:hypothetical protein